VLNGKNMSPLATYQRYFIAFMVIGFVLGCLISVNSFFVVPFFANIFLWGRMLRKPACPRCHTPVAPTRGASLRAVLASFHATICRQCGSTLSK
jgi:hypothetical protein